MSVPNTIYDLPASGAQVHLHGTADRTTLYGGRVYDYSRGTYRTLNSYEAAMADYHAEQLGLKRIIPK